MKKLDEKRTYKNVQQFFQEDFDQLQRLSQAESLVATNDPSRAMSGSHKDSDSLNISHYSYKQLYEVCLKAIDQLPLKYQQLLTGKYIRGMTPISLTMKFHIGSSTLYEWQRKAYVLFADNLFVLSSQSNPKHPIDFRIYEGD